MIDRVANFLAPGHVWISSEASGIKAAETERANLIELIVQAGMPSTRSRGLEAAPAYRDKGDGTRIRGALAEFPRRPRWGRQNASALTHGKPLGSFETWAEWCRDPLLALGCRDPVERTEALKANDPHRQRVADLFHAWHERHESSPTTVNQLDQSVRKIADPQERGRQYLATFLSKLVGTHAGGFVLTRQEPAGKWGAHTYAVAKAEPAGLKGHRTHRTDSPDATAFSVPLSPMDPMGPMPNGIDGEVPAGAETEI